MIAYLSSASPEQEQLLDAIINEFRSRGFECDVSDGRSLFDKKLVISWYI